MEEGICVTVKGEALHEVSRFLHERGLALVAQLHSHPTDAYHSETDDTFPITTRLGSVSIVLPDFAQRPFSLAACAVYRLTKRAWVELSVAEATALIHMDE